tara:strand:- start:159 stop:647 length:489 start_codon:yes stop_codon:yes gene_type:complete
MRCERNATFQLQTGVGAYDVEVDMFDHLGRCVSTITTIHPKIKDLEKLVVFGRTVIARKHERSKVVSKTIHGVTLHGGFNSKHSAPVIQSMFEDWFYATGGDVNSTSKAKSVILWEKFVNATNQLFSQGKCCEAMPSVASMSKKEYRKWKRRQKRAKQKEGK